MSKKPTPIQEAHLSSIIANILTTYDHPVDRAMAGFAIGMGLGSVDPELGLSLENVLPSLLQASTSEDTDKEVHDIYVSLAAAIRRDTLA